MGETIADTEGEIEKLGKEHLQVRFGYAEIPVVKEGWHKMADPVVGEQVLLG